MFDYWPEFMDQVDFRDRLSRCYDIISGIAAVWAFIAIILGFGIVTIGILGSLGYDRSTMVYRIANAILEMTLLSLSIGFGAVYILRLIFNGKEIVKKLWNTQTPPFHSNLDSSSSVDEFDRDLFLQCQSKALFWGSLAIIFLVGSMLFLVIIAWVDGIYNILPRIPPLFAQFDPPFEITPIIANVLRQMPFISGLWSVFGELPGDTILGKIIINLAAVGFALSFRNICYMYENRHVMKELSGENLIQLFLYRSSLVFPVGLLFFSLLFML